MPVRAQIMLVFVNRLQRPLADLRLVGCVSGIKLAAQQHMVDHRRDVVIIRSRAPEEGKILSVVVGFAQGHEPTVRWAKKTLETAGKVAGAQLTPVVLHSTLGRHAARMIRTAVISELADKHWSLLAENIGKGDTRIFNEPVFPKGQQQGFGFHEAPRGTLSHWIVIDNGTIKNYQAVVPSTWNAGPRDAKNQPGPYEASLVGNPIADVERPLEVLRTVHSFDPCIACAIHTLDVDGREMSRVRAL